MNHSRRKQGQSRGFTLLELLIVIAIITMLMGLLAFGMRGILDSSDQQATTATIRKLDGLIQKRAEAFDRAFRRDGAFRRRYIEVAHVLLEQKGIYTGRQDVVEVLARKIAFRHQFPQRHEDLLKMGFAADGLTPLTDYQPDDTLLPAGSRSLDTNDNQIADIVEATATDPSLLPTADVPVRDETVSSELLYFTLVHYGNFGSSGSVAGQFGPQEVADTDNDGLLEFIDAWGNPLQFYRWPTRLMDTDPPVPFQPNLANLNDPTDVLQTVESPPGSGTFVTVGVRTVTAQERTIANLLFKGLPPSTVQLPNGVLPRDLLLIDPDDPIGRLYSIMEVLDGSNNLPRFADEFNETWYHTPDTYHTPLIVSAGPDGDLGLYHAADTPNLGNLAQYDLTLGLDALIERIGDNITNRNRLAGANR